MKAKIGVIIASVRDGRNGSAVKEWVASELEKFERMDFIIIDLKDREVPHFTSAKVPAQRSYDSEFQKSWSAEIEQYDGYIIVTPEYNRGVPGALKDAIDHLFHEWSFKPIAFIGYSTGGAYRSVEHLQTTSIELSMVPIRRQLAIPIFDAVKDGKFIKGEQYAHELEVMLKQLQWWAEVLRGPRMTKETTI